MENNKDNLDKLKNKYTKIKKPLIVFIILFFILIIVLLSTYIYKFTILKKVFSVNNQFALGNNFKRTVYSEENIVTHTTYYKDGILRENLGDSVDLYFIKNKAYYVNNYNSTYTIEEFSEEYVPGISLFNLDAVAGGQASRKNSTQSAFEYLFEGGLKLKKDFIDNKEYLVISTENSNTYIDLDTYFVTMVNFKGTIHRQTIETNVVTDTDVLLPDLTTYNYEPPQTNLEN